MEERLKVVPNKGLDFTEASSHLTMYHRGIIMNVLSCTYSYLGCMRPEGC